MAVLFVVALCAVLLSGCGKKDSETEPADTEDSSTEDSQDEDTEDTEESEDDGDSENEEEETSDDEVVTPTDFSNFSEETQSISAQDGAAQYSLTSILDTEMNGYHRFQFTFDSSSSSPPAFEAKLVSSGGYIRVWMNNVTSDSSGIAYQTSRNIDTEGIIRIYHAVTPIQTEEVYQIGIVSDTVFYVHKGDGNSVLVDVKYPGEAEDGDAVEDPDAFTDQTVTLGDTNASGDVRIVGYAWSASGGVLTFAWNTSVASGNPIPPTKAEYSDADDTVTVTFTNLGGDTILGSGGTFETGLSSTVAKVTGTKTASSSVYTFHLSGDSTYRIYRSLSPNQVVLEIQL